MKIYAIIAAAVLLAGQCLGPHPETRAATNAAVRADGPENATSQGSMAANTASPGPSNSAKATFFILAEFTQSLNARKLKPGDRVKAEVTQDVLSHGKIVIPAESKLVGHITEVKSHHAEDPGSRLGIVFDKVLLKHRMEVDFRGVLHALSAPAVRRSRVDQPDPMLSPSLLGISRSSGPQPMGSMNGRTNSAGSIAAGSPATNPAGPPPSLSNGAPVGPVPTTGAGDAAGGIPSHGGPSPAIAGEQKSMSVGMPLGVFGLKGLSLTSGTTDSTPGPVILSRAEDVKLESGTQVLLKVTGASVTQP